MTTKNPTPARLFVLLARTAPMGLILRRGPSDWVQLIEWNTKTDVFRQGQWFHGRIFEHRCDLSPNGKYLVYRAFKPNNRLHHPDVGDSWTAVSKPPNFTAVGLWVHWNSFGGGGYFYDNRRMLLNHLDDNKALHPAFRLPKDLEVKTIDTYEDEYEYLSNHVHGSVMKRDGWSLAQNSPHNRLWSSHHGETEPANDLGMILEKSKANLTLICGIFNRHNFIFHAKRNRELLSRVRRWTKEFNQTSNLRPIEIHSYSSTVSYQYRYSLKIDDVEHDLAGVTWADFDKHKRLVLAKDGKLFSALTDAGELVLTELGDFNYSRQG